MLSSESRYNAKMEESEMKEDCTKEKANERQRETDAPQRSLSPWREKQGSSHIYAAAAIN